MGFVIKRLYFENYKLFDYKLVDFADNTLSVFDGPNGYGKTSTFDAIEYLVTGNISRIAESGVIAGTTAYDTVFLAKDTNKDVLFKGEFVDRRNNRTVVIGIRIDAHAARTGKENNPKTILENAENYILPSFDLAVESWKQYLRSDDEMLSFREEIFGKQNLTQFTLFHYIRQEDRLSYFNQSEKERNSTIETLMGIEEVTNKQKKLEQIQKDIAAKAKELDKLIESNEKTIKSRPQYKQTEINYFPLLSGEYPWDRADVAFDCGDKELLQGYVKELDAIKAYVEYKDVHKKYNVYKQWNGISEDKRLVTLKAWLLQKKKPLDANALEDKKKKLVYLEQQNELIMESTFLDIPYIELCKRLNVEELGNAFSTEMELLKSLKRNQDAMQNSVSSLISLRNSMHKEHEQLDNLDSCPYCGTTWKDREILEKHFVEAESVIKDLMDSDGKQYEDQYSAFKNRVITKLQPILIDAIEDAKSEEILKAYIMFDSREQFGICITRCEKIMKILEPEVSFTSEDELAALVNGLKRNIEACVSEISDEYLQSNADYNFDIVASKYFADYSVPDSVSEESIENKKRYIFNLYLKSFDELNTTLDKLKVKKDKLAFIQEQVREYLKAYKTSVQNYEKQIIDQIEIPFFVYSSRLLQSYQGGQGVLMKNDGKSVRFTAPGSEHDVLYTMSSGQLSAVLLSFSLAMNKIYAGDGIQTIFIDDPIQCMDDINMISFVELLRREFANSQIILSTHEEHFSNYIRYKFKKYNIETQAITLKEA